MKTDPNEAITAIVAKCDDGTSIQEFGLTKREYFAAIAMQGMISQHGESGLHYSAAEIAVQFADQLIDALNK